jgi:1-acyl-sn-glycerol-3-phosphate acyltransferase
VLSGDDGTVIPLHGGTDASAGMPPGADRHPSHRAGVLRAIPDDGATDEAADEAAAPSGLEQRLAGALAFVRRRIEGDYPVDGYGFDPELADALALPLFRTLYEHWFRVEVTGIDNVPDSGGALLVANHAGGIWPVDAAMTAVAVHTEHPEHRFLRPLAADLLFETPALGPLARRSGATLARHEDAELLLRAGELVGVWPEGFKGMGKPYSDRYQLRRFGRGGFVRCAIRAGVPIVPVSIVGSEEIYPVLGTVPGLARLLKLPYFPITPTFPWLGPLGLVPLPSKWHIEFGTPLRTDELARDTADDPSAVFDVTDQVRETIQATLYRLLAQRGSPWR